MERGYLKLYRKTLDSAVWDNPRLWRFWSWCLLRANYKERTVMVGMQAIPLKPGQFVYGRARAARETGLSERSCRTCLNAMKKLEKVTTGTTSRYTIITIVKWGSYNPKDEACDQQTGQEVTSNRPAGDPQVTTDKKGRKKEGKNKDYSLDRELSSDESENVSGMAKCPQKKILDLYHRILPELPGMLEWNSASRANLRARWQSRAEYQNTDWWQGLFSEIRRSDFLMGRVNDFRADLGWIVKAANFQKIVNGNYKPRGPRTGSRLGDSNARACREFLNGGD